MPGAYGSISVAVGGAERAATAEDSACPERVVGIALEYGGLLVCEQSAGTDRWVRQSMEGSCCCQWASTRRPLSRAHLQALEYHPDKNPHGEGLFKRVVEAYDILGSEESRRKYDLSRRQRYPTECSPWPLTRTSSTTTAATPTLCVPLGHGTWGRRFVRRSGRALQQPGNLPWAARGGPVVGGGGGWTGRNGPGAGGCSTRPYLACARCSVSLPWAVVEHNFFSHQGRPSGPAGDRQPPAVDGQLFGPSRTDRGTGLSLTTPIFCFVKDSPQGPPTATNHQQPTATNCQPLFDPVSVVLCLAHVLTMTQSVPVNVRFCWRSEPFLLFFPLRTALQQEKVLVSSLYR